MAAPRQGLPVRLDLNLNGARDARAQPPQASAYDPGGRPRRLGAATTCNAAACGVQGNASASNWQVGRFLALENSPDIIACLMKGISQAGPIADKPAIFCCLPCCVTRGQSKAR